METVSQRIESRHQTRLQELQSQRNNNRAYLNDEENTHTFGQLGSNLIAFSASSRAKYSWSILRNARDLLL